MYLRREPFATSDSPGWFLLQPPPGPHPSLGPGSSVTLGPAQAPQHHQLRPLAPLRRLCAHESRHLLHQHTPFPDPLNRQKRKGVSDHFYLSPLLEPDGVLGTISVQHMERGVFQLCYLVGLRGKEDAKMLLVQVQS